MRLGVGPDPTQGIKSKSFSVSSSGPYESRFVTSQGSRVSVDRTPTTNRNRGKKHLPYSELMNRKAQGLCFRCGEKYHPLHQCAERQLRLVVLANDETINEEREVIAIELREEEADRTLECGFMGLFAEVKISCGGRNRPSTLRLEGRLHGVALGLLIDSGASHNFISPHVVVAMELKVDKGKSMGVRLGDGHKVSIVGKCKELEIQLGEFSTVVAPYVLELGDVDMILGVAWL